MEGIKNLSRERLNKVQNEGSEMIRLKQELDGLRSDFQVVTQKFNHLVNFE